MKLSRNQAPGSLENYTLSPDHLAQMFSHDWFVVDPQITDMKAPFKLRPEHSDVQHVLVNQEYIVVKGEDPYQPADIWNTKLDGYKLSKQAEHDGVNVFQVPSDVVTLSAILNDSVDGDPELFVGVFAEIGAMFRDIADAYNEVEKRPITSAVTIDDIAFVKGRKAPFLLPPFSLDLRATGESPVASIEADLKRTPLNQMQTQLVAEALNAFEESYGSAS